MPTAPVPANRSSHTESGTVAATTLNRVSRRRSEVGRVSSPSGAASFLLLYLPAITRMLRLPGISHLIYCIKSVHLLLQYEDLVYFRGQNLWSGAARPS